MNNVAGTIVDATGANPNVDAFTFEVAEGTLLDGIFLNESTVNVAFLGINDSNTFPFDAAKLGSSVFSCAGWKLATVRAFSYDFL